MPFFSIIIPAYNRSHCIKKTVDSVLAQTFYDFELIVVDDGSTDQTGELVMTINDPRIRYVYQGNSGVCAARNKGASLSTGDFLIFLDSDDEVRREWLSDFAKALKKSNSDIVFCGLEIRRKNEQSQFFYARDPLGNQTPLPAFIPGTHVIRRSLFFSCGMYDEFIRFGENMELRIRLDSLQPKLEFVEGLNLIYHDSSEGGSKNLVHRVASNLYIVNKHLVYFRKHPHPAQLLLNVAAVSAARLGRHGTARRLFWRSFWVKPFRNKSGRRLLAACIPFLMTKIWKPVQESANGN